MPTAISTLYVVPDAVQQVLQRACYDCHSNNTKYPWYANVQPFGWLLAYHVKDGKEDLNFSEFGSYPVRKQRNKLQGIANSIKDDEMPLTSYKWMHPDAKFTKAEKELVIGWASKTRDSLGFDK